MVGLSSARALATQKAIREGRLNEADLQAHFDKLTGRDLQSEHDGMVRDEHAAIVGREAFEATEDAPFSLGRAADDFDGEASKSELEAIEKTAVLGSNGKPLAPNGKESNLPLRLWAMVRTKKFRNWFGDWLALRVQEQMAAMNPAAVTIPDEWRGKSVDEMRVLMAEKLDGMVKTKVVISHPLLGNVKIGRRGANKTKSTSGDPAKMLISADLESLFPQSILGGFITSDEQGVDGYSKLLIPLEIDEVELVAIFSVRHQTDGQWYYNTVAVEFNEMSPAAEWVGEAVSADGINPRTTRSAGDIETLARKIQDFNPERVSKIVDENGEPLVVWHGTNRGDFETFDTSARQRTDQGVVGKGFYFGTHKHASQYGPPRAFFLRILDPATAKEVLAMQKSGFYVDGLALQKRLRRAGYDGVIAESETYDTEWVTHDPTQIKSVDNRGSFDPADERFRYSLAPASMVDSMAVNVASRIKDPRVKAAIFTRMLDKLGELRRDRDELGIAFGKGYKRRAIEGPRKTASIRKEAAMREALRREELENEARARHGGILHGDDLSKLWNQPTWEEIGADPFDE